MSYNPIKDYEYLRDRLRVFRTMAQGAAQLSLLEQITEGVERLRQAALANPVTDYHGPRELRHDMEKLKQRRYNQNFDVFIVAIDLDKFGDFNKRYGEKVGDAVLKAVANILKDGTREYDTINQKEKTMKGYHKHGEEFQVVLQAPSKEIAWLVANRLRKDIEEKSPEITKQLLKTKEGYKVTATFGMTKWNIDKEDPETAEARADQCMQQGKKEKRNNVYYVA